MKLIDLLVRELPKRGGWPEKQSHAWQDMDGEIRFGTTTSDDFYPKELTLVEGRRSPGYHFVKESDDIAVTRSEYEAALEASNPQWDGDGLPPVGYECMVRGEIGDDGWYNCKIIAHTFFDGYNCAVFQTDSTVSCSSEGNFRPIRSEADKKRDNAIGCMEMEWESVTMTPAVKFEVIYDAISEGKIPGVKLEG